MKDHMFTDEISAAMFQKCHICKEWGTGVDHWFNLSRRGVCKQCAKTREDAEALLEASYSLDKL